MFINSHKNRHFVAHNIVHKRVCIILAICLIFSSTVSASALPLLGDIVTSVEAGRTVAELFNMVLESKYGTNTQLSISDTMLITINWTLHYLFDNTYGYDIVNPYSGSADTSHVTMRTFGQLIADINNSLATMGIRFFRPMVDNLEDANSLMLDIDNDVIAFNGSMNNALYDYNHIGQSSFSVGSTSRNTAVNTQNIRNELANINWSDSSCDYTGAYNSSWNTINPDQVYSYTDYYFRYSSFNVNRDSIIKLELPMIAWSNNPKILSIDVESGVNQGIVTELYYYVSTPSNHVNLYLTPSLPSGTFYIHVKVQGDFKITTATDSNVYYLPNSSEDYFKIYDFIVQYNLLQKDYTLNGDVSVDTSELENKIDSVIDVINDLSLVDNNVHLTPVIDADLPSNGTSIVNRLRNFFSTGVTVGEFFAQVDNAEADWYSQSNSDVINTLSGGYVNLYE